MIFNLHKVNFFLEKITKNILGLKQFKEGKLTVFIFFIINYIRLIIPKTLKCINTCSKSFRFY